MKSILLDSGTRNLKNWGDTAMLQVTVKRIHEFYPSARIAVITEEPEALNYHVPNVVPVDIKGLLLRSESWNVLGALSHFKSVIGIANLESIEEKLWRAFPDPIFNYVKKRFKKRGVDTEQLDVLRNEILNADLVALTGGGYIADNFLLHAKQRLFLISWAQSLNIKTVMWGQGLGPIDNPRLANLSAIVFKKLDMLMVRENIVSDKLAIKLGMNPENIILTGDDAIYLAKDKADLATTNKLGFNLRVSNYSGVDSETTLRIDELLRTFCSEKQAEINVVPISSDPKSNDKDIAMSLPFISEQIRNQDEVSSTEDLSNLAASCKVVITGSYHAAVFSLSAGVPVLCVVATEYYENKFEGLASAFGSACVVFRIDKNNIEELGKQLNVLWEKSDDYYDALRLAAEKQVSMSKQSYIKVLT